MTFNLVERDQTAAPVLLKNRPSVRQDPPILGRMGSLETRLARNSREIDAAQRLRYQIFVEEMNAVLSPEAQLARRDFDRFDDLCDHLVVIDTAINGDVEEQIIGTYRLLRDDVARNNGGFYSASEFDIEPLLARHAGKKFMELGRSCVLPKYRNRRTVELLWQGNWAYALAHGIEVMFGCASFPGKIPEVHALAFAFLHHHALARDEWAVSAHRHLLRTMDLMPVEAANPKQALLSMPPLMKGYLRLGAKVGHGAVVDCDFGTTDVLVVLPIASISGRYLNYYGADAGRFAS